MRIKMITTLKRAMGQIVFVYTFKDDILIQIKGCNEVYYNTYLK